MSNISRTRNPLSHNGTSQYERLLEALTPEYFKIDDRSLKDLLHATFQHSQMLVYYNEGNQDQGDWACFWKVEMLTFLAHLSTIDAEKVLRDYKKIKEDFEVQLEAATGEDVAEKTNELHLALIEYLGKQALKIEEAILYLPDALPLKQEIIALVERDSITDTEQLAGVLKTLIGFHKEANQRSFDEKLDSDAYKVFFKKYWGILNKEAFYDIDHSDEYRFNDQEALDKLLKAFYQTLKKIKNRANYWFDRNLDTPQLRQPHVALFLTFLRLFNHARNSLNSLTKKHLEFYYEKVLCLRRGTEVPDDAYLILELAATVDQHLVEKGTPFIGGKDVNGRPLIFETIENWFLNRTEVKDIKTTYIDVNGILTKKDGSGRKQILAAPDVKTAYKDGEELPNEVNDSWRGMGDNVDLPNGEIGFAIASPQLILREGKRVIDIVVTTDEENLSLLNLDPRYFKVGLSTVEEVVYLELNTDEILFQESDKDNKFETGSFNVLFGDPAAGTIDPSIRIKIILERDDPAIEHLESGIDDSVLLNDQWPFLILAIQPIIEDSTNTDIKPSAEIYRLLRSIKIEQITIDVDVQGIRDSLILQNDQGVFDGTQKFYPFGPIPEVGDQFYIGSTEVFQKNVDSLKVKFEWIDPPFNFETHYNNYVFEDGNPLTNPRLRFDFLDRAELLPRDSSGIPYTYLGVPGSSNTINGVILDVTGEPLIGATVFNPGSGNGATTDIDGNFTIEVSDPNTNLVVSYSGFNTLPIPTLGHPTINIILSNDNNPVPDPNAIYENLIGEDDKFIQEFEFQNVSLERDIRLQDFSKYSPSTIRGFMRCSLNGSDFYHKIYQNSFVLRSIIATKSESITPSDGSDPDSNNLPKAPYTPNSNGISLDYTSSQIINIGVENDGIDNYYHLYPFKGYDSVSLRPIGPMEANEISEICLLPQYDKPTFKDDEKGQLANGNLYIGLANLKPGSNLSLLIQLQEGSELNPDVAAPIVNWAYLAKDNEWKPLSESKILKDTTKGLRRTGIVQITTPKDMVSETTLFEGGCYWLRVAVSEELELNNDDVKVVNSTIGLPSIVNIQAQAILVQFKNDENDLSHLAQALPAGEIGQLEISRSAVKGIDQPFPSFNGELPEEGNMFYVRVSERLRHRDRAVQIYDYERLLLDRFPKIQRAKCLNHTKPGSINILDGTVEFDIELAPGYVTVAVIPELKMRSGEAAAEPRFSQGDLEEMAEYLRTKTNLFVAGEDKENKPYLRVVNPLYEEVKLCFNVQFKIGEAPESRRFDLDRAIKAYLAPWLYQEDHDITFGRTLNRSKIILFVEQLSYVDAISDFEMIHCGEVVLGNELIPTTSRSVITTVIDEDDNPDTTDHKLEPVDSICETSD